MAVHIVVEAQLVADVGKVHVLHVYALGYGYGLGKGIVAYVRLVAQGIKHQGLAAVGLCQLGGGYIIGIGNVGKIANAETQYLQLIVQQLYGGEGEAAYGEGHCGINGMERYLWYAGVCGVAEYIMEIALQRLLRLFGGHIPVQACC